MNKLKNYFSGGHIVESFAILPSINYSWMHTSNGKVWEIQFVWFYWYFSIGNIKNHLENFN